MMYFIRHTRFDNTIIQKDDGLWIPDDPANTDYQAYLAWVAEGNIAEEWTGN